MANLPGGEMTSYPFQHDFEVRHAHQFSSRLHHVIFYSEETGEENGEATLITGTSLSNNVLL